jgi:hypothetical protein
MPGNAGGWLAYWLLPRAQRRVVRRIEVSCRAVGDPRLDGLAAARLRRAARRERWGRHGADTAPDTGAEQRLARLCSTMRHPSRTGECPLGTSWVTARPARGSGTRRDS